MRNLIPIALCLAILTQPVLGEDRVASAPTATATVPLVEMFEQRNPRTLAVLAADFPQDHRALLDHLAALEGSGHSQMVLLNASFDAVGALRRKYADRLLFAPPQALANLLATLADFYDAVLDHDGAALCGKFAQDGSGVLFQLAKSDAYMERVDAQSAAYFDAVVKAIEAPEYYGASEDGDWPKVLGTMVGRGAPQSYVISIAAGSAADPNLCPALAAMFRTVASLDTPEGLRTRADFAKNLAGY
jgi:hypothetical protein